MVKIPAFTREVTSSLSANGNAEARKVTIRRPEVRFLLWVEQGWLNVRRTTWDDETEWQVVLARASDPQRPVVDVDENLSSLRLTYRDFFIRDNGWGQLRIYREPKSADSPEWPVVTFERWEFEKERFSGGFVNVFESDYWTWLQAGPMRDRPDVWLRVTTPSGERIDGRTGLAIRTQPGPLVEVYNERSRVHVEPDLLIATYSTIESAEKGIAGKALANRLSDLSAPRLTAREWFNSEKPVDLEDLKGQCVLIGCWATWSESSVKRLRQMQSLHKEFGARGLKVIGIHAAHKADKVDKFLRTHDVTFPVMIDASSAAPGVVPAKFVPGETAGRLKVQTLPAFFLIDRDGTISSGFGMGPPAKELIENSLK